MASTSDMRKALYDYTQADIPGSSVVPVGDARANRRDFYERYKLKFIGDLKLFISWIKSGALIEVIDVGDLVKYQDKQLHIASINPDGTFNLSENTSFIDRTNQRLVNRDEIFVKNVHYNDVIRVNPDNRSGVVSKPGLKIMVDDLILSVKNISDILLELKNPKALGENFTIKTRTGYYGNKTNSSKGKDWLSDQAKQFFGKITEFYDVIRNLRNRDAADTIHEVKKILDKFVSECLQLIIPTEIKEYNDSEMERERKRDRERRAAVAEKDMEEERGRRVKGDTPRNFRKERSRSISPVRGRGSPIRLRGGKSMKPKQHRNSKTQKKRQRKNQKK